jgi:hypothetical protein
MLPICTLFYHHIPKLLTLHQTTLQYYWCVDITINPPPIITHTLIILRLSSASAGDVLSLTTITILHDTTQQHSPPAHLVAPQLLSSWRRRGIINHSKRHRHPAPPPSSTHRESSSNLPPTDSLLFSVACLSLCTTLLWSTRPLLLSFITVSLLL